MPPVRAEPPAAGARRAIQAEARLRLPGELPAGIVLRHEFHIAVLEAAVLRLVLDAEIRQFQVTVNHRQLSARRQTSRGRPAGRRPPDGRAG